MVGIGGLLSKGFEKIPEYAWKNDLRYFLAFNSLIPNFVSDMSPVKGYEMKRKLKEGDVVVDAGAYPGDYAVYASRKVGKEGKVICFEPDKKNASILRKNLEKEGVDNFVIIEKGLWNKNTKLKIRMSEGLHTALGEEGIEEIEVVKLDDELKNLGIEKVDVIKMDIEGAEIQAVEGCKKTLKDNNVHTMIASYHVVDGEKTAVFLEKFLSEIGYKAESGFERHLTTWGWKD
tara:strand:+ start:9073 stop:9768 length:696 start_codon:yes stop_codon:yes gene_type:complete